MNDLLPFVVSGLTAGSIYGIAGMGLVLTYRTSGVFNFAHGAVAAVGAYAFWELHHRHGLPWPLAALACVVVVGPALGWVIERLARGIAPVRPTMKIVATVGLLLAIQGAAAVLYGSAIRSFPPFLPTGTVSVAGVHVGYDQLIVMLLGVASAIGLYVLLRRSRLGTAMRALVDDPDLLSLDGIGPGAVRRSSWILGSTFAAASGVLIAPNLGLDAILLTLLVVQAFGAAAIGRFSSLPLTYAGGLVVGVGAALSQRYVGSVRALAGFPAAFPFIVLFAVLLLTRRGQLVEARRAVTRRLSGDLSAQRSYRPAEIAAALVGLAALTLAVPHLVGPRLPVYTNGAVHVLVFLSLGLLVWTSGQISLCHAAFVAVGATTFSHLAHGVGLPWGIALAGAVIAAVPVGAIVAIPAIRLSGIYLALATFGFGLLMERLVYSTALMFGARSQRIAPRPDFGTGPIDDRAFFYLVVAIVALAGLAAVLLLRSRLGRLLRALGDSPLALETYGASITTTRVLVFCCSAGLAAVAGVLFASSTGSISGVGLSTFQSLVWLTVLAISGTAVMRSAVIAGILMAVVPSYLGAGIVKYQTMAFGALAMVAALSADRIPQLRPAVRRALRPTVDRAPGRSPLSERTRSDVPWTGPVRGRRPKHNAAVAAAGRPQ